MSKQEQLEKKALDAKAAYAAYVDADNKAALAADAYAAANTKAALAAAWVAYEDSEATYEDSEATYLQAMDELEECIQEKDNEQTT